MAVSGLEYRGVSRLDGPLLFIEGISDVAYDELVEITRRNSQIRDLINAIQHIAELVNDRHSRARMR